MKGKLVKEKWVCAAALALMLAACSTGSNNVAVIRESSRILQIQTELEQATLDLSKVVVARMTLDGQPAEVSSLSPAVIAEAKMPDGAAKTIFRFNKERDTLVFFTRDGKNGIAYRADLPVAGAEGKSLVFPVLNADGSTSEKKISIVRVIVR